MVERQGRERHPTTRPVKSQASPRLIRAAELVVPQRPAPWTVAGLGLMASILTSLFISTLNSAAAPHPAIAWTLSGMVGTIVFSLGVALLARLLRREHFGPGISWPMVTKVYGGYFVAGFLAALAEHWVRDELILPVAYGANSYVAHLMWFWLVGLAANAFGALRRRVIEQDVALRERVRDLDRTRALLARADERVRREAAEVLHGRVQSRLLASQVRLERAAQVIGSDPALVERELAEVVSVLDDLRVNDVRFTSHQLHPPTVRISLLSALRSLIATFEGSFAVDVHLCTAPEVTELDDPTTGRLDEPTRLVLYRVLEEALQNAYRHGRATEVEAELTLVSGPRLQLRVTDNGCGFDPDAFTAGLGVASIAARVEDRGGAWWISSSPGAGTTLTAVVPVPPASPGRCPSRGGAADASDVHPAGPRPDPPGAPADPPAVSRS